MEILDTNPNRPPDITPVSFEEFKQWERGERYLSAEQIFGALAMQQELCEQPMKLLSAV